MRLRVCNEGKVHARHVVESALLQHARTKSLRLALGDHGVGCQETRQVLPSFLERAERSLA